MIVGHKKQWEGFKKNLKENNLSHAYLFTGQEQLGKKTFAKEFVKFVNCKNQKSPCQNCESCNMIEGEKFPDLMVVNPEEDGGEIKISQIRKVQNFLSYKSYYGENFKAVIVDQADKMNNEAQSCFLKTLEEPRGNTIIFLISSKSETLLQTIFSRCQIIKFYAVSVKDIKNYLEKQGATERLSEVLAETCLGRPGRAIEMFLNKEKLEEEKKTLKELLKIINSDLAEKFKYVKSLDFEKQNPNNILEMIQKYLRYLLFVKMDITLSKEQEYFFSDTKLSEQPSIDKIKSAINLSQDISSKLIFTNANPKLALEILLMEI